MVMNSYYTSAAHLVCYEGAPDDTAAPSDAPAATSTIIPAPPGGVAKSMTQEEVNAILMKERIKYQETLRKTEENYKQLLSSQTLSEQERAALKQNLEMVQGQLRTKEEQAAQEKKALEETYQKQLAEERANRESWEKRYHKETIERVLLDAAVVNDAYSPHQISMLLKDSTKLVPVADPKTGKPTGRYSAVVELPMTNPETGEVSIGTFSPPEAVKHMKEDAQYANLFKANVVSGLGANSAAGGALGSGKVNPAKLTHEQYRELRKTNPAALGLRPGGSRGR